VPAPPPIRQPRPPGEIVSWVAAASIVIALVVMGIKYLAYARTGSVGLYSDALESLVNVATAIAALVAIRIAAQPADRNHPFGHHKVEYFSAVLEGALVIVAAVFIIQEAFEAIRAPRALTTPMEGLLLSGVATAINAAWAFVLIQRGGAWRSPALVADGWHLVTDVVTSLGVIAGVALAAVTGWTLLDPFVAVAVALNILVTGWRLATESLSGLMDRSVDTATLDRLRKTISKHADGAIEVHDLRTRVAASKTFIEFHLVVPAGMTVAAAHVICDRLEAALEEVATGAEVLIHIEPEGEARHQGVVVL
jgi:cation diffusion facilitator family transporter